MNKDDVKKENAGRTQHKRMSKVLFVASIILVLLVVLAVVTSLILLFFPVGEFEVVGDSKYTYAEIIEGSEISEGAPLYFINKSKAEKRLLEKFPYLESVNVEVYFPNRVKIEIKQFDNIYMTEHESGYCFVNGYFEVLEIVEEAPSFERFSDVFVKLENPISLSVGETYEGEDASRAALMVRLLEKYGFYQYLNIVDVAKKYDVAFVTSKKYKFVLGAMSDLEDKIDASFKVCFSDSFEREGNCIIDSTNKKSIVLRYIDDEILRLEFDFCK